LLLRTQHQYPPLRASSARRVRDGLPADLRDPCDYPAEALCLVCGRLRAPMRSDSLPSFQDAVPGGCR